MVKVLYSLKYALDISHINEYDFSGYGDTPLTIYSPNETGLYFWKDVHEMLENERLNEPFFKVKGGLMIGFEYYEGRFDFSHHSLSDFRLPFSSYGNFSLFKDELTDTIGILNLHNNRLYKIFRSERDILLHVMNGCSLNNWDIFDIRKDLEKRHLFMFEQSKGIQKVIPIHKYYHLEFVKESPNQHISIYLRKYSEDNTCEQWFILHVSESSLNYSLTSCSENSLLQDNSNILAKETILEFTKKAVYEDLCLCSFCIHDRFGTVIFPTKHFNYSFLSKLGQKLATYGSYVTIPNFLRIEP